MKSILLALVAMTTSNSFAMDMSRTESYKEAYKELADGSTEYVGGCAFHQDYEGRYFKITKTIVESFEPREVSPKQFKLNLKAVEPELLAAASAGNDSNYLRDVDDITLEKAVSSKFPKLDLYRFNIGVGGGNGYYEFYFREVKNNKPVYTRLSNVFDGDVETLDALHVLDVFDDRF